MQVYQQAFEKKNDFVLKRLAVGSCHNNGQSIEKKCKEKKTAKSDYIFERFLLLISYSSAV